MKYTRVRTIALYLFIFIMAFAICLPWAQAAPPFVSQVAPTETLSISYPTYSYVQRNTNFSLHFHVVNSTGVVQHASCDVHIYNITGKHTLDSQASLDLNGYDYELEIDGKNFTTRGPHAWIITCNSTNEVGFAFGKFFVNDVGEVSKQSESAEYFGFWFMIIISAIFFFGFIFVKGTTAKWNFLFVALMFMLISLNLISARILREVEIESVRNFFDSLTGIVWIGYWFLGVLFLVMWIFTFLNTHFYKKHNQHISKFGNAGQMP